MSIDVEEIRQLHVPTRNKHYRWCSGPWPCVALRAADELAPLRADQVKARQALAALVGVDAVPHGFLPAVLQLLPDMTSDEKNAALERARVAMVKRRGE